MAKAIQQTKLSARRLFLIHLYAVPTVLYGQNDWALTTILNQLIHVLGHLGDMNGTVATGGDWIIGVQKAHFIS